MRVLTLLGVLVMTGGSPAAELDVRPPRCVHAEPFRSGPTDLVHFQGHWILAFSHLDSAKSLHGDIVVRKTADGIDWQPAAVIKTADDDVHPHLLVAGDRLLLYFTSYRRSPENPKSYDPKSVRMLVSSSGDGKNWSEPAAVWPEPIYFYRPRPFGKHYYVAAHNRAPSSLDGPEPLAGHVVSLLRSSDGLKWERVSDVFRGKGANETELIFDADGGLTALVRCEVPHDKAHLHGKTQLARSLPPYRDWSVVETDEILTTMTAFQVGGQAMVLSRHKRPDGVNGLSLHRIDKQRLILTARLPHLGGDIGYPGVAFDAAGRRALISYYGRDDKLPEGVRSAIYVSELLPRP